MSTIEDGKVVISDFEEKAAFFEGVVSLRKKHTNAEKHELLTQTIAFLMSGHLKLLIGTSMYLSITGLQYFSPSSAIKIKDTCKWYSPEVGRCIKDHTDVHKCLCEDSKNYIHFSAQIESKMFMDYFCDLVANSNNQLEAPEEYKDLIDQVIFAGGKKEKVKPDLSVSEIYEHNKELTTILTRGFPATCVMCEGSLTLRQVLLHNVAYCHKCCG